MKRLIRVLLSAITFSALFMNQASATVPPYDARGEAAYWQCPAGPTTGPNSRRIYHFDKIVFKIMPHSNLIAIRPNDTAALNRLPKNYELDIKVIDNPRYVADVRAKVLTFLGASNTSYNRSQIKIVNVEYSAVVCS